MSKNADEGAAQHRSPVPRYRVLAVDDQRDFLDDLAFLMGRDHELVLVQAMDEALRAAADGRFDVALLDLHLEEGPNTFACLEALHALEPDLPIIMITGDERLEMAVAAVKRGATDYVRKSNDINELEFRIFKAIYEATIERENRLLRREREDRGTRDGAMIGNSPAMQELWRQIESAAPGNSPVLILGETGSGKEVAFRALHRQMEAHLRDGSPAGKAKVSLPYRIFDCMANQGEILRTNLFGTEANRFTGVSAMPGVLEDIDAGVLLLDEFTEIPLDMQGQLHRLVQSRTFCRHGTHQERTFRGRIVAATNRDPERAIAEERLKPDLYYRLCASIIKVPPLRQRREDVPLLAGHFIRKACADTGRPAPPLTEPTLRALCAYDWPGNVRQLEQVMHRFVRGNGQLDLVEGTGDCSGDSRGFADLLQQPYSVAQRLLRRRFLEAYFGPLRKAFDDDAARIARAADTTRQTVANVFRELAAPIDTSGPQGEAEDR